MKLSSRQQLLKEADVILRQIREEQKNIRNTEQLNEGALYNIWKKFVNVVRPVSIFLAAGVGLTALSSSRTQVMLGKPSNFPITDPLALVAATAALISVIATEPIDKVLSNYFQSKHFDEKYRPILDELTKRISNNPKIRQVIAKLTYLQQQYKDLNKLQGGFRSDESDKIYDALFATEKEMNKLFDDVMNDPELMKKFIDGLPSDERSFAGEIGVKGYKEMMKKELLSQIKPTTDELVAINTDMNKKVKSMQESIKRRRKY